MEGGRHGMDSVARTEQQEPVVRKIVVGNTTYHVGSIFIGQTNLDDALKRIISRRLEERCAADATQEKIQQTALV